MAKKKDESIGNKAARHRELQEEVAASTGSRVSIFCPFAQRNCRVDCEFLAKASLIGGKIREANCILSTTAMSIAILASGGIK